MCYLNRLRRFGYLHQRPAIRQGSCLWRACCEEEDGYNYHAHKEDEFHIGILLTAVLCSHEGLLLESIEVLDRIVLQVELILPLKAKHLFLFSALIGLLVAEAALVVGSLLQLPLAFPATLSRSQNFLPQLLYLLLQAGHVLSVGVP